VDTLGLGPCRIGKAVQVSGIQVRSGAAHAPVMQIRLEAAKGPIAGHFQVQLRPTTMCRHVGMQTFVVQTIQGAAQAFVDGQVQV
jgi:hypothetical protein